MISEAQFMAEVVRYARLMGFRTYHTRNSRGSDAGFPDLVLIRPPRTPDEPARVIFAELKAERNHPTAAQLGWLNDLQDCGQETFVWRPSDWRLIENVLA